MEYRYLFNKGKIGTCEIRNRVAMTSMGNGLAEANGEASDALIRLYEERAKGGIGLILTEFTRVDPNSGKCNPCQLCAGDRIHVKSLQKMAERVHRHGGKIFVQLHHGGREAPPALNGGMIPFGPSEFINPVSGIMCRAMTQAEIKDMIAKFVNAAVNCQKAGIDGVELHAAHGYLLGSFVSPLTNRRQDEYGGSIEKNAQMVVEVVQGIKKACGKGYPVMVRINGSDFVEEGKSVFGVRGTVPEEAAQTAKILEEAGADAIDVSCSVYITVPNMIEPNYYDEGWRKNLAKTVKANVNIPVLAVNTVKHPETAEALLAEGVSDFVGVSRGHFADPEFCKKAKAGREDLIRKCMGCMECNRSVVLDGQLSCAANPRVGRECEYNDDNLKKNGEGRTVVVIGAGVAGMQAALVLKQRGFNPVILEAAEKAGGMANLAAVPPHKTLVAEFIETQIAEMKEYGIEIKYNTKADVDTVKAYNPYAVVVAVGGTEIVPKVDGLDQDNVYPMEDILTKKVNLEGKKIAVIGGGMVGLETTEYLSQNNDVTIIEMTGVLGNTMYPTVRNVLVGILKDNGVDIQLNRALTKIDGNKIVVKCMDEADQPEVAIDFDDIVIAVGRKANLSLVDEMETICDKVVACGDCVKGGNIKDATRLAMDVAWVL